MRQYNIFNFVNNLNVKQQMKLWNLVYNEKYDGKKHLCPDGTMCENDKECLALSFGDILKD